MFCYKKIPLDNLKPADGELKWRSVLMPNGKVRFNQPNWVDNHALFRHHYEGFDPNSVKLNPVYLDIVNKGENTVIPSHPWQYCDSLDSLTFKDVVTKDQHKIFLYSTNKERIIADFNDKVLPDEVTRIKAEEAVRTTDMLDPNNYPPLNFYDTLIEIDRAWVDWEYLNEILIRIGIDLPKSAYDSYLLVSKRP